ncbi:MAG: NADH-quinone oxidoreductase subunit C [Draconibacterium sp.]|nr:NADH-quinone oxidoreductase subunit C [Draconibacterium sp.]
MKELINKLSEAFEVTDIATPRPTLTFVTTPKESAISLVTHLRDYEGFSHFVLMSCVDWIEDGKFQLLYLLHNPETKKDLGVKTLISRENSEMASAHHLWKQVWTYQRELKEAFGIDFPGSPRVDENFVLEGWTEMPHMRRDFDTKEYSEKTYFPRPGRVTNDPATYMREKLYPNEPITAKKQDNDK